MSVKLADKLERVRGYGERRIPLGPGVVWIANPDLGTGLCFPLLKIQHRARLVGPAGAVETLLTFASPSTQEQEAYFLYPLSRSSCPLKIRGKVGDHQFETEVEPRPQPEEEREQASLPPELCKLFAEESEHVLAIPLGKVPGGAELTFQVLSTSMAHECGESGSGFSFQLPLMVSRALTTLNPEERQVELAAGLERGAQVSISIQIEASDLQPGAIRSSQPCGVKRAPNGDLNVEFDRRKPLDTKDFILDYELWSDKRPKAWLRSQGRHFILNFFPPSQAPPSQPRRLVILVDGSEEMNRIGIDRCHQCLSTILKKLDPADKFALVAFNREVAGYKNGDFVDSELAPEALQWMADYRFNGAADLKDLLRRVVTLPRQSDSVLSVVLISAGRIGNEPELYRLLQSSRDVLRLFPVMLGHRSDPHFARAAARLTGGYAFRPLHEDSISRAAERVLEHTRQPVLEGVGIQDRGLQYQGESLTPKYPSGLNWKRPITVMGQHSGQGGLEAGGVGPGGNNWSEALELKPAFHKMVANVWALVKSSELADEVQMLGRSERNILQNVIKNLSLDFGLLNRYTIASVKSNQRPQVLVPPIEANLWFKKIQKELAPDRAASELLEEQKSEKTLRAGMSQKRDPGRGLRMKEVIGKRGTATQFGSKLAHRNKLSGNVKEGLFSKPMFKGKALKSKVRVGATGGAPTKPLMPTPKPARDLSTQPVVPKPVLPTTPIEPEPRPVKVSREPLTLEDTLPKIPAPLEGSKELSVGTGEPKGQERKLPPFVDNNPVPTQPEQPLEVKALPTTRELVSQMSPEARGGNAQARAVKVLSRGNEVKAQLMKGMRTLHSRLSSDSDAAELRELTEGILWTLAGIAADSELLIKAYDMGYKAHGLLSKDKAEASKQLKRWLVGFAKLFK